MAARISQVGPVQGVEMKGVHTVVIEGTTFLGSDRCGNKVAGFRLSIQANEQLRHPGRNRGSTDCSKFLDPIKVGHW